MHNSLRKIVLLSVILFAACGMSAAPEAKNTDPVPGTTSSVQSSVTAPAVTMDQATPPCSANEEGFKTVTMGPMTFELPVGWSSVYRGDIGVMPLPPDGVTYLDGAFIRYSFAKNSVAYGDINWTQVDVYFTENDSVIPAFIDRLKNSPDAQAFTDHWETQTIGGQEAIVQVLKKEPDGTVDKGGTGGAFTYFPKLNMILAKQSFGDAAFEAGFEHFLTSVRFQ